MPPPVAVESLQKSFRHRKVLEGVSLEVQAGEIVALLGPNGAGKSTLLRILATSVRADAGRASVMGADVEEDPARVRRCLGTMFGEDRGWYWRLSARRNVEFFGVIAGADPAFVRRRTDELLGEFELADDADKQVGTFSSGMRARLGLVRALLNGPPVLLLDEPSSHLDPLAAVDLRGRLKAAAATGTCVLIATHDLHEAAAIADRVVGVVAGNIAFQTDGGEPAEELERRMINAV